MILFTLGSREGESFLGCVKCVDTGQMPAPADNLEEIWVCNWAGHDDSAGRGNLSQAGHCANVNSSTLSSDTSASQLAVYERTLIVAKK